MTVAIDKAERELAVDLRAVADNPRTFLQPRRIHALIQRGLIRYDGPPREPRDTPGRQKAPPPRAKKLTDKGQLTLALLERQASERRAIAGAAAARHGALP